LKKVNSITPRKEIEECEISSENEETNMNKSTMKGMLGQMIISRLNATSAAVTKEEGNSNISLSDIDINDYNDQIPCRFDFRSIQMTTDSPSKFTLSKQYSK
jgi:hypothetical protein